MRKLIRLLVALAAVLPVNALAETVPVGSHYITQSLTNSFTTLIEPSSNTNGAYLRTCTIETQSPPNNSSFAFLSTSNAGNPPTILLANAAAATFVQASLPYPLFLPPGVGLYGFAVITGGLPGSGAAYCTYDFQS